MKINIAIFLFMPFILYSQIDSVLIQIKRSNQLSEFSGIVACYNLDSNNYLFLKSANLFNERIDTRTMSLAWYSLKKESSTFSKYQSLEIENLSGKNLIKF